MEVSTSPIEDLELSDLDTHAWFNDIGFFVAKYTNVKEDTVFEVDTSSPFNILKLKANQITGLVNYKRMNDHRFINKVLEAANAKLDMGGVYICCVETMEKRKERILNKFTPVISYPYFFVDFIVKRAIPKLPLFKQLYFSLTKGTNRVVSLPEAMGRIYSCGFKIIESRVYGSVTWFALKKVDVPHFNLSPTYGALVTLNRVGYKGEMFKVYKMRTMHPYSEYIQEYLYLNNNLKDGGKIQDDFRITTWGKVLRKLWIDEFPMLLNLLRGEMKLVGVRPLSKHFFGLYPSDMQEMRIRHKPGLVPPFYADMPVTFEEIVESERRYLEAYAKAPLRTDFVYFCKAFYNILIKRARSS